MRLFSAARGRWPTKTQVLQAPGVQSERDQSKQFNPGSDCGDRRTHSPGCRQAGGKAGPLPRGQSGGACQPPGTGPPTLRTAAWVKCAGETQALGQVKWEQLLVGPRGRTPDFLARGPSLSPHSSCREERRPPRSCRGPSVVRWWDLEGAGLGAEPR